MSDRNVPKGGVLPKEKSGKAQSDGVSGGLKVVVHDIGKVPKDKTALSCRICNGPDDESMVQCDECDYWHHFNCVGVQQDIANRSWSCPKCVAAKGFQRMVIVRSPQPTGEMNPAEVVLLAKTSDPTNQQMRHSDGREKMQDNKGSKECGNSKKSEARALSVRSGASQKSVKLQLQMLEEEKALQKAIDEKEHRRELDYLRKKYELLEQVNSEAGSERSHGQSQAIQPANRIQKWIEELPRTEENCFPVPKQFEPLQNSTNNFHGSRGNPVGSVASKSASCKGSESHRATGDASPFQQLSSLRVSSVRSIPPHIPEQVGGDPSFPVDVPGSRVGPTPYDDPFDHNCFSRQQIAARQAISRELPVFAGNPEEWPIFVAMFNSTTSLCGFSDEENLIRLQRSLKGKAYDAVRSRLMHPSNVPGVMKTLKLMFGQPEAIVQSLIGKINALPALREDKFDALVEFAVKVQNFCATVDACELEDYMYNVSLLHQLVNKLPPSIKLDWARYRLTLPRVNLATFGNWVYTLAEAASTVVVPHVTPEFKGTRSEVRAKKGNAFVNAHSEPAIPEPGMKSSSANATKSTDDECIVCRGRCKGVSKCKQFLDLSRKSRFAVVREFGLCCQCLRRHKGSCKAKPCGRNGCSYKHHELLHNDHQSSQPGASPNESVNSAGNSQSPKPETSAANNCNTHQSPSSSVLFRYLPVILYSSHRAIHTYAFLDEGSALTLVDQELADELQLDGPVIPLRLRWTGGTQRQEKESQKVSLEISGTRREAKRFTLSGARTVRDLLLPQQTLDAGELRNRHSHLRGIPVDSYKDARPRILIGLQHAQVSLVLNSREGRLNEPIGIKTRLGWTVCGGWSPDEGANYTHYSCHVHSSEYTPDQDLHEAMKRYFSLDSVGICAPEKVLVSADEQRAQTLLQNLTKLVGSRYETGLLWRHDNIRLPDNRTMALKRHECLQRRMEKDPALARTLHEKIADYVAKDYIRKLSDAELGANYGRVWYLPIFPVINPNKPGKLRIVWDAAATAFGVSLNSALLKGPDELCSLFAILLQFREHSVGLTGDIREMFHQIRMRREDQQCLRFFWTDENGELGVYVMQVMTFGACCSPSCAQFVKNINADRHAEEYPEAAEVIKKKHYVDDMLVSVSSEEHAVQLAKEVKFVHKEGGFEIRNWVSNSRRVLQELNEDGSGEKDLDLSSAMGTEKVLGMWWCTSSDMFVYKIGWQRYDEALLKGQRPPTKREVLRVLMSIYDPLGLIAHYLIFLKVLLQDIWRSGVAWDETIGGPEYENWQRWVTMLPQIEKVRVPRHYRVLTSSETQSVVELHTFVDASNNAFAAAAYLRFVQGDTVECSLVGAKTRVAPLKFLSTPRMELQAALVGARLAKTILKSLSIHIAKCYYWTDSRDVYCWLNSDHRRYSSFVAFRVSEILDITEASEWHWLSTKVNVADDATKWEAAPDLTVEGRWFKGPDFLWSSRSEWPVSRSSSTSEEVPSEEVLHSTFAHHVPQQPVICVSDFSSWVRLTKVVAFVYRFIENCRRKSTNQSVAAGPFTSEEMGKAESSLYRLAQSEIYQEELKLLQKTLNDSNKRANPLPKRSSLFQVSPWLDEEGVMRIRTRIEACQYAPEDAKKPVILPRDHPTTNLVISHYHHKYHHGNHETTINELRQKYYVPRIRTCYSKVVRNCQWCKNERATPQPPIMAPLPPGRLEAFSRPFTHTGIDYFGPMEVIVGRRTEKRWCMLATCLTVRAVHIEVVHSLSSDSCIMALRSFICRRGQPRVFYSDRGTNFIGACREIQAAEANLIHETMMKEFVNAETSWSFNPPLAPHMGGSWERLIGSVKRNLAVITPSRRPTDEVLRNTLAEIENMINSRPLTRVPIDMDSAAALTPNHFLLGSSNGSKPLSTIDDNGATLRQNWLRSQVIANQFWKRWIADYLPEITRRTKWFNYTKPVEIGDIVVIVDSRHPRNCWPKGKVIATCVGRDGEIRSATVRTANAVYDRPVAKLAILDVRRGDS